MFDFGSLAGLPARGSLLCLPRAGSNFMPDGVHDTADVYWLDGSAMAAEKSGVPHGDAATALATA
jgi:hypothetical protein